MKEPLCPRCDEIVTDGCTHCTKCRWNWAKDDYHRPSGKIAKQKVQYAPDRKFYCQPPVVR